MAAYPLDCRLCDIPQGRPDYNPTNYTRSGADRALELVQTAGERLAGLIYQKRLL